MKRYSFFLALLLALGVVVLGSQTTFAQGEAGSITGAVSDPQGGTVAGADVALTDVGTKSVRTTVTNESGRYHFASVPAGVYDVTITKQGFKVYKAASQKVSVGNQLTLDIALEVGALTETVVVTAAAGNEMQTSNATIGTTINLKDMELLPNLGRDASTLMSLQPGVTARGDVAGSYMDQNTFTIDGGNNTDDMAGNTIGYINNFTGSNGAQTNGMASGVVATPIESVEEFKVNTVGQTADFNSSAGAQVMMVTRRGTDQWHGSGYGFYYGVNHFGANSWANNHTQFNKGLVPASKPLCSPTTTYSSGDNNCIMPYTPLIPNHRSRFGFSVGGAVIPKKILGGKTYLFFNYEGFRFPNAGTFERNYPTVAYRAGVIQVPGTVDGTSYQIAYNLNPTPVITQIGNSNSATNPLQTCTIPGYGVVAGAGCRIVNVNTGGVATFGAGTAVTAPDPRNLGMSPTVRNLWNNFLPLPNDSISGDQYNTQGFLSTLRLPLTSNSYVGRIDHDFGSKNHFFTSFRSFKLLNYPSGVQVDVGGIVTPGTSVGTYVNTAQRPQLGELWVLGLTSNINSRMTNDLRVSYLWNWWQWSTSSTTSQLPGVGAAQGGALLEIAPAGTGGTAESVNALIPFNVNTQSVRQRVWDGQDKMLRDDVTWVKGNHLIQFGGLYEHNFDYHTRTDNGSTVNNQVVYQIAYNSISGFNIPTTASGQSTLYQNLLTSVYGMVGLTQVIYTRAGSDLHLLPLGTQAQQASKIPTFNFYGSDTWHFKPNLTINYGLGYTLEMPPVEQQGRQVELVDSSGNLVHTDQFLAARKAAALAGQGCVPATPTCAIAPQLGFETTGNLHLKYPYSPFYGGISPRISVAWNPNFKSGLLHKVFGDGDSVIRGGYNLAYGRLNGVNLVLVPLLGPGPLQSVTCGAPLSNGTCGSSSTVANAFRIGADGLSAPLASPSGTLPQPYFPGIAGACPPAVAGGPNTTCPAAGDSTVLDPDYKPEKVHSWDFTIQRSIGKKMFVEVGYIGKKATNIFEEIDLDAVPYMMTLGGQSFAQAFASTWQKLCTPGGGGRCTAVDVTQSTGTAADKAAALLNLIASVPNQPFFEAAFGGTGSSFCGALSCTQALLRNTSVINSTGSTNLIGSTRVSELWAFMNSRSSWALGRTMLSAQATAFNTTTSLGYSNYNAGFVRFSTRDWKGITSIANFTYGHALGTGEIAQYNSSNMWLDNWNKHANYGPAVFDYKFLFNLGATYQPTFFRGRHGWSGRLLDGWSVSPYFFARSGNPIGISYTEGGTCSSSCQAFGQAGNVSTSGSAFERALPINPTYSYNPTLNTNVQGNSNGVNGVGVGLIANNPTGLNGFTDPSVLYNNFRRCILGIDSSCGGINNLRGLTNWNMDATIGKEIKITERVGFTLTVQFTNVLNHFQATDQGMSLTSPQTFGAITGAVFAPRQVEFGGRIHF